MKSPTKDSIKKYWDSKAENLKTDPSATMKDVLLRTMEIQAISARLNPSDTLLDIGCGNAFGSIEFARHCKSVLAVDYSEKMIAMAKDAISNSKLDNISTQIGDVLTIGSTYPDAFSSVSSIRCLINLPDEKSQYQAIDQLSRALVVGGRLFLLEGVAEHFAAMNVARQQMGLSPIELDWHNRLFAKDALQDALKKYFVIDEIVDFGEYYFLSRIVHPLLTKPDDPSFNGPMNHIAREIWLNRVAVGKFSSMSTLVLYIARKV